MIKMFYLVYGLTSGGIERISVAIYKYLDHSKINTQMVTKYADKEFFDSELELYGGHRVPILEKKPNNKIVLKFFYLFNLYKLLKNKYDIAYFCLSKPRDVFKYPIICKFLGIKTIAIHSHNSMEDDNVKLKKILNKLGRRVIGKIAQIKIACSEEAAMWMFPEKHCKLKEYLLMKNGIEIEEYKFNVQTREKLRKQYEVESDFIIGHVGRFSKQKNHKFLIDIFEKIYETKRNSKLFLLGIGELEEEVQDYIKKKNLDSSVVLVGERNNVCEFMQMFDVFLFPSLYEGLPVVGVEAQAAGLRCFFSDTITKDVNITGNIFYMNLSESPKKWADFVIEKGKDYERKDYSELITEKGFDIQDSVKKLERKRLFCTKCG